MNILKRMKQACGLLCLLATMPALAQELPDPTQPPALGTTGAGAVLIPTGPVLQSVLITPDGRIAIISGKQVGLGERYRDARVVKITESEVVLHSSEGDQTLKLYPGVEMKAVTTPTELKNGEQTPEGKMQ